MKKKEREYFLEGGSLGACGVLFVFILKAIIVAFINSNLFNAGVFGFALSFVIVISVLLIKDLKVKDDNI